MSLQHAEPISAYLSTNIIPDFTCTLHVTLNNRRLLVIVGKKSPLNMTSYQPPYAWR